MFVSHKATPANRLNHIYVQWKAYSQAIAFQTTIKCVLNETDKHARKYTISITNTNAHQTLYNDLQINEHCIASHDYCTGGAVLSRGS